MPIRGNLLRRIELRRAWFDQKQRATATKQELRWKRRAARWRRKPAPDEEALVEETREEAPEEGPSEEAPPEERTIPSALFPE